MTILFLWKGISIKELTIKLKKNGGRNSLGQISVYHKGGGHAQRYRFIDYKRIFFFNHNLAIIRRFDYDPNRKSYLALICYENNYLSYILANEGMVIGQILGLTKNLKSVPGVVDYLKNFLLGAHISNIEHKKNYGGIYSRAAGTQSYILKKYMNNVLIKLPSKQLKLINNNCLATFGTISNVDQKFNKLLKAGQKRWQGSKSIVRGVAMNPVDHPHGGGEGKTSGGRCSVSPWGILTKGYPTVRGKKRKLKFSLKI